VVTRDDPYRAIDAWRRAWVFFACCLVVGVASGAVSRVLSDEGARRDGAWPLWAAAAVAVVVNGYVILWPRWTFTEDRPSRPTVQVPFGLAWGLAMGLLFLSIHEFVALPGWGPWGTGLVSWLLISAFQGMWHELWWDVKVSPPHNVLRFNGLKIGAAHVPNMTLSLVLLVAYGDARLFVALQMLALTASVVAMRFPPPSYVRSADLDADLPALQSA
jgi:hypothetical protein